MEGERGMEGCNDRIKEEVTKESVRVCKCSCIGC